MNATYVDPRVVAEALHMDTMQLAELLTKWAGDALPRVDFTRDYRPMELDAFDERVATARTYLVEAHAAMQAYDEDNPETEEAA